jgi:hypothetical protein
MAKLSKDALAYFRQQGSKGGRRSLETMTPEARAERARKAGLASASARAKKAKTARAK